MKLNEIIIRDPFILSDVVTKKYYMYGTTNHYDGLGFYCYVSENLEEWLGPYKVFTPPKDFWGKKDFWAPEAHIYRGEYYMFATFKNDNMCRGCQILHSLSPLGPFEVHSKIITPSDWECLDGTLYVNQENKPYMIFCHEWLQINDGTICAIELSDDLKTAIGEVKLLFHGSDAKWSYNKPIWCDHFVNVTDGPFVYQKNNINALLWSTYGKDGYVIGVAYPKYSFVENDYIQEEKPLPIISGGHGMIFTTFDGKDKLVVHVDNDNGGHEHPSIVPLIIKNGKIGIEI